MQNSMCSMIYKICTTRSLKMFHGNVQKSFFLLLKYPLMMICRLHFAARAWQPFFQFLQNLRCLFLFLHYCFSLFLCLSEFFPSLEVSAELFGVVIYEIYNMITT